LTNEPGGVIDAETGDAFTELAGLKLGSCTLGGTESAILTGLGTVSVPGVAITVSE
jgi:hypothetical protein